MSVRSARRPVSITVGPGMSHADGVAVVATSAAVVVLLALTHSNDAFCYLLAFPIWIVSRDLGVLPGAAVGVLALLYVVVDGAVSNGAFGPLGYLSLAAVLLGVVVAGGQAARPKGGDGARPQPALLRVLTARPEITRGAETLSSRELEVLEMIATGAKNAEIADRFVISQNTVKSHVGAHPEEAVRQEPHRGRLPLRRGVRAARPLERKLAGCHQRRCAGNARDRRDGRIDRDGIGVAAKEQTAAHVARRSRPGGPSGRAGTRSRRCRVGRDRLLRSARSDGRLVPARRGDRRGPPELGAVGVWVFALGYSSSPRRIPSATAAARSETPSFS